MGKKLEKLKNKITNYDMENLVKVFGDILNENIYLHKVHDFKGFLVLVGKTINEEYHFFSLHDNHLNYFWGKDETDYFVSSEKKKITAEQLKSLTKTYKKFLTIKFGLKAVKGFNKGLEM